jgi:transcriptional regulator with XRE-family HTH domain
MVNIEEWLEKERKKLGISEAELAQRASINQSVIYNAKTRNSLGPEVAVRLAHGLGRSQAEVFYELGLMTEKPGEIVIKDDVLRDIWKAVERMARDNRLALRVFIERIFVEDEGEKHFVERRDPARSDPSMGRRATDKADGSD